MILGAIGIPRSATLLHHRLANHQLTDEINQFIQSHSIDSHGFNLANDRLGRASFSVRRACRSLGAGKWKTCYLQGFWLSRRGVAFDVERVIRRGRGRIRRCLGLLVDRGEPSLDPIGAPSVFIAGWRFPAELHQEPPQYIQTLDENLNYGVGEMAMIAPSQLEDVFH